MICIERKTIHAGAEKNITLVRFFQYALRYFWVTAGA